MKSSLTPRLPVLPSPRLGAALAALLLAGLVGVFIFELDRVSSALAELESPPQVSAALDGAYRAVTGGDVTCNANEIVFHLSAAGQPFEMVLTSARPFPATSGLYSLGGPFAGLELTLPGADGAPYRRFTAAEGDADITEGRGILNAVLFDEGQERLVASARWRCS